VQEGLQLLLVEQRLQMDQIQFLQDQHQLHQQVEAEVVLTLHHTLLDNLVVLEEEIYTLVQLILQEALEIHLPLLPHKEIMEDLLLLQ
tara:strand:- start:332 stop:595 length:264 start_codon:yes stop_codon:yes gene_type:complete